MGSKAITAYLNQSDFDTADKLSPLGNASPDDLANWVIRFFRQNGSIIREISQVDVVYNIKVQSKRQFQILQISVYFLF